MVKKHIWSNKGIAFYPPDFPIIGQNKIFNALNKYKYSFSNTDIAGFFVLIGDWGLGKTRIGYELFAETTDNIDEWLLNPNDYILNNTDKRILLPQLAEGILPLFIDYRTVVTNDLEQLDAETWVAKVSCNALSLLWDRPTDLRVSSVLLDDMVAVIKAKGINLSDLKTIIDNKEIEWKDRLDSSMEVLRTRGINNLWVVVDEVETPGDLKKNPDYKPGGPIEVDETEINLISVVIKEARYREDHPYVNFLLLCSLGVNEIINIGPNRRRCELIRLEPNQISDVKNLQNYLGEINHDIDYPAGTLEGVFIATNRNFGWFNKVMSSIYTSLLNKKQKEGRDFKIPESWELIEEYAQTEARANEIFNTDILLQLKNKSINSEDSQLINKLAYSQLPFEIGKEITKDQAEKLFEYEISGIGKVFAPLIQINIDNATLTDELVKPENGFKHKEGAGDILYNPYSEFSVRGILSALKAFSISINQDNNFVIYDHLDQFVKQLTTLYSYDTTDNKDLEQVTDTLYKIFKQYELKDKKFIAVSFDLLKKINVKMSAESKTISFFKDNKLEKKIEEYFTEKINNNKNKVNSICRGFAKALDDNKNNTLRKLDLNNIPNIAFESDFKSPPFNELSVTGNGRITVVYCNNTDETVEGLKKLIGKNAEFIHPIIVLFGPNSDKDGFDKKIQKLPLLKNACIIRNLSNFEEEFLIKYSGRDDMFDSNNEFSSQTHATLGKLREDLRKTFREWRTNIEGKGLIIRPILYKKVSGISDFYKGYREMLVKDFTIDNISTDIKDSPFYNEPVAYANFQEVCKKNTSPGQAYKEDCLEILDTEPFKPIINNTLIMILKELQKQTSEDNLAKGFFFAVKDKEIKGKQISQVVEFLDGIGVIISPANDAYKLKNKNYLDELRIRTENWLNNTAVELINEIKDIFPDQARSLEKGFKQKALNLLEQAEKISKDIDYGFLDSNEISEVEKDLFKKLVTDIYNFEKTLEQICPLDLSKKFDFKEFQIKSYQEKYNNNTLSFWEKVNFLRELRKYLIKQKDEMIFEINKQIADSNSEYRFITINDSTEKYSFPLSPVIQPLRSIQEEIESAFESNKTVRQIVKTSENDLKLSVYLSQPDYEGAYQRLNTLYNLVFPSSPENLWKKFITEYEKWKEIVLNYKKVQNEWDKLNEFIKDSPNVLKEEYNNLKKEYEILEDQITGGLENDINNYINNNEVLKIINKLKDEIEVIITKPNDLLKKITSYHDKLNRELYLLIDDIRLQALNHLLRALGQKEWIAPKLKNTYKDSKNTFETFNLRIAEEGKNYLENNDKKVNWELWLDIYSSLSQGKKLKNMDWDNNLQELENMGLVERTVKLK